MGVDEIGRRTKGPFRAGGSENAPAQGRRRLDRLDYESEGGSSLCEPDEVCSTALAEGDAQLE